MFIFKGIKSTEMMISCQDEDFLGRASLSVEQISIEGKDGSDFEILNYNNFEKNIIIFLRDNSKLDEVLTWLNGKGQFVYNGRQTTAYFLDTLEAENLFDKAFKLKTKFIRYPIWHKQNDEFIEVTDSFFNEGNVYSRPLIKITGTGKTDISINDVRFIYNFDTDPEVVIDCQEMIETYNGTSKSKNIEIGFKYPLSHPGENKIIVHSGTPKIFIKRKDAWL